MVFPQLGPREHHSRRPASGAPRGNDDAPHPGARHSADRARLAALRRLPEPGPASPRPSPNPAADPVRPAGSNREVNPMKPRRTEHQREIMGVILKAAGEGRFLTQNELPSLLSYAGDVTYGAIRASIRFLE